MGCEMECSLIATRTDGLKGPGATFSQCAVLDAPMWLPDGYYEATFSGQSAFLHRVNGVWGVGIPWRQRAERLGNAFEQDLAAPRPWSAWGDELSK